MPAGSEIVIELVNFYTVRLRFEICRLSSRKRPLLYTTTTFLLFFQAGTLIQSFHIAQQQCDCEEKLPKKSLWRNLTMAGRCGICHRYVNFCPDMLQLLVAFYVVTFGRIEANCNKSSFTTVSVHLLVYWRLDDVSRVRHDSVSLSCR